MEKGEGSSHEKGEGSSHPKRVNALEPHHFLIDLQNLEENNDAWEVTTTDDGTAVRIDIPGCSNLLKFNYHVTHIHFVAEEDPTPFHNQVNTRIRTYEGSILFPGRSYKRKQITNEVSGGVVTFKFASST